MIKIVFLLLLPALLALASQTESKREKLRGYFFSEKGTLYFTQIYHSTAPVFRVEWWREGERPSCLVSQIPSCPPETLNFEPRLVTTGGRTETVLTRAILESELGRIEAEARRRHYR